MRPPSPTISDPQSGAERGAGLVPGVAGGRTPIRVVLAEQDPCVRRDMLELLHSCGHGLFEVVAETGDTGGARRFAHAHRPCVVVLDLDLPGSDRGAIGTIHNESPDAHIVVLALQHEPGRVCDALREGATGYVLKGCAREALAHAVRRAAAGYGYLIPVSARPPGPARGERRPGWPGASSRAGGSRARSRVGV